MIQNIYSRFYAILEFRDHWGDIEEAKIIETFSSLSISKKRLKILSEDKDFVQLFEMRPLSEQSHS